MKGRWYRTQRATTVSVVAPSAAARRGLLQLGPLRFPCALGRSGSRVRKREGDGATPIGDWPIRQVLYRADRLALPPLAWPARPIQRADGWCDDAAAPSYNRAVLLPCPARAEQLWRDDGLYDVVVVLGHNDDPPVAGLGSAIFMHVARSDMAPTEGCVALAREDLLDVLKDCDGATRLSVSLAAPPSVR